MIGVTPVLRSLPRVLSALVAAALVFAMSGSVPARRAADAPAGITLAGLDAHDGTVVKDGDTYYLYGTRYGCGYQWQNPASPFCGFGVWTSSALAGPWTFVRSLFDPLSGNPERGGEPWRVTCNYGGNGCFNPRMVQRFDGVWILFFNAPAEVSRGRSSAYYAMGCNSPAGPCGAGVGGYGSTRWVPLNSCTKSGDFTVAVDGATAYLACSNTTITIERLDYWWTTGVGNNTTGAGAVRDISYLSNVEGPGLFRASSGEWVLTYSDPGCGYCSGTSTSYSVSANGVLGVWLPPTNAGYAAPVTGRGRISGSSCGGQPRTAFGVDGWAYEWIDAWYGAPNETNAAIRLEPLVSTGPLTHPADATPWAGGFQPFTCN